jgi:hypothetical protein
MEKVKNFEDFNKINEISKSEILSILSDLKKEIPNIDSLNGKVELEEEEVDNKKEPLPDDIVETDVHIQLSILRNENPERATAAFSLLAKINNLQCSVYYYGGDRFRLGISGKRSDCDKFIIELKSLLRIR